MTAGLRTASCNVGVKTFLTKERLQPKSQLQNERTDLD